MPSEAGPRAPFGCLSRTPARGEAVEGAAVRRDAVSMVTAVATIVFILLASATYLRSALLVAGRQPFWSDEILAVWVARLPTLHAITQAIWHGAEFSPPTYDVLLHVVFQTFGSSLLTARLPSILAILYAAGVLGWIVQPRLGLLAAALAFGLVLNSALFDYAVQARPYALLTAIEATILLLWSGYRRGPWRPALIGLLLLACVSLHIYAIVAFAVFALMEGLVSLRSKAVRPAIWLAFAAAALASTVWLPLILHLAAFNSGDVASPDFYGAPTLQHLLEHFDALFRGTFLFGFVLLAALLLSAGAVAAASVTSGRPPAVRPRGSADVAIMAAGLIASLPIGFLLAVFATHVFSARYALPATLGAILLLALALTRLPFPRVVGVSLCALLAVLPLLRGMPQSDAARAIAILGATPGPVVVSDSNLFLEMMENAPSALRDRLVHLTKPAGVVDGDTSADHQLARLVGSFRPDLPVVAPDAFMAAHARFAEICRPGRSTDALCAWFVAQGRVVGAVGVGSRVAVLNIGAGIHAEHP